MYSLNFTLKKLFLKKIWMIIFKCWSRLNFKFDLPIEILSSEALWSSADSFSVIFDFFHSKSTILPQKTPFCQNFNYFFVLLCTKGSAEGHSQQTCYIFVDFTFFHSYNNGSVFCIHRKVLSGKNILALRLRSIYNDYS
jgi:hypothetical protein